jgi:hexosaminidase
MRDLNLVPLPRSIAYGEGSLDLRGGAFARGSGDLAGAAELAALWCGEAFLLLGIGARFSAAREGTRPHGAAVIEFILDPALPDEDYSLSIAKSGIEVRSGAQEGAAHAAATLRQILLSEGPVLPCLRIEDGPRFSWRGAMLDCSRNFFRPEFIERFIDLMALHKLNRFHWHLTDDQAWRLELKRHPELALRGSVRQDRRYGEEMLKCGSYSQVDVSRIVSYAAARGIVVVPEIESPGHALALLASHPELSCRGHAEDGSAFLPEDRYGIFEDVLCAGNDEVFDLLGDVYDEVAGLFPGLWVHAGGDEAPKARWRECPLCRARMEREGLHGIAGALDPELLQGWFMNRIAGILAERGKRMLGWDEILDSNVRKDAIIHSWRGPEGGIRAARAGYDAVMSPQTHACYLDHKNFDSPEEPGNLGFCTAEESYAFDPVPTELSPDEAKRILGGQANIWTEFIYFGRHVEYMAFPRLCALSEVFWSPKEKRDFESFERRMEVHGARLDLLGVNRYRGPLQAASPLSLSR